MTASSVTFCPKTSTALQDQPDGDNPNTTESMMKTSAALQDQPDGVTLNTTLEHRRIHGENREHRAAVATRWG
jgi:hypothetical protein